MSADYLSAERGLRSWLTTTDHKRIGVMFLVATTAAMLIGGLLALLIRTEHLTPDTTVIEAHAYNRTFTAHGIIMVWLFLIPAIPSGFGNFLVPMMIGAKDIAFPRLNLASLYIYVVGAVVTLVALTWTRADTGWTFYTPYSTSGQSSVVPVVTGIAILGVSSIITGINFIVTTHALREKGVRWFRMPLFVWAIYATSLIQVIATPVLAMVLALVGFDALFDFGIFDPARGGDPLLFQHLFWFYSHPAVYIMILPAMGVITEVVCTASLHRPASYHAIAWSSMGIAIVGFLTWGHHMFVAGQSSYDAAAFGILSMLVAVFSAIKVFTWVGTLRGGAVRFTVPLAYACGFLFLFVFGGLTGVAQATVALDVHWHDTYFIVAHFHFIMVGGAISGLFAAMHYWFPKITGRMYDRRWAMVGAVLIVLGFVISFTPQFLLGNAGMPRRYHDYPESYQALHVVSTAGSYLLGLGTLIALATLVVAARRGPRAGGDPWNSRSYEWRTASPPPVHNFTQPLATDPGPYDYAREDAQREEVVRG